jgi:glutamyl-tRNA synthetase
MPSDSDEVGFDERDPTRLRERGHYIPMSDPQNPSTPRRTRLAPSPTGDLHLGNARTFLLNWALARREGWTIVMRHEDLDGARTSSQSCLDTESSLRWIGIDWDEGPHRQSDDLRPYLDAMHRLGDARKIFRSELSRREIREALGAPHPGGELRFPASLRPTESDAWGFVDSAVGHRYAMEPGSESVEDELHGSCLFDPGEEAGDPVVWTRDGTPGYQLAVVVDDLRQGITDVVRGDDLLPSAARQQRIARSLGAEASPRWWHLPIVHDADHRRLAKRDGDDGLGSLRAAGVPPERIVGLLLHVSGLIETRTPEPTSTAVDLIDRATLRTLVDRERRIPCRVSPEDLEWLRS